MSKLIIKFPTRNRPEKFKVVFQKYIIFLSGRHDVQFIVSMDADDPTMNNDEIRNWLVTVNSKNHFCGRRNPEIMYFYGNSKTKVEACNANLEDLDGDVLLLASDDMVPQLQNYDQIIFDEYAKHFPDFNGAIKFNDGLRKDNLMTLCVMGWKLYKEFGYIYHPDYTSLYCDTEQSIVLNSMNKLAISDLCIIKHEWSPLPWDELHAKNENREMYIKDRLVFDEHMVKINV